MPPPNYASVKICFNGEIHRFRWDIETNAYNALHTRFCETFPSLADHAFSIQYTDRQGDVVTVSNNDEYYNAWDDVRASDGSYTLIRFTAVACAKTATFQEHVADPILKAIEKLVATLTAAMEKVKHEDWKARAQSGVETTHEAFQSAANDARASLHTAHATIREIPIDQLLKDTTDGIKVAADGIRVFAHDVVAEIQKEQIVQDAAERLKTAAETVAEFAKDAVDELKHLQIPHGAMPFVPMPFVPTPAASASVTPVTSVEEPMAEVVAAVTSVEEPMAEVVAAAKVAEAPVSSSADSDWEQVAAQSAAVAESETETETETAVEDAVVEVEHVSADELKWALQLATIRDILPNADTHVAIERLEQADGDVQVVLNALMEAM